MKKSSTIRKQKETLEARLAELEAERQEAKQELDEARDKIIVGTGKTPGNMVALQTRCDVISGTVDEVQGRLTTLELELADAEATEAKTAKTARAKEISQELRAIQEAYATDFETGIQALADRLVSMLAVHERWETLQLEFRQIFIDFGGNLQNSYMLSHSPIPNSVETDEALAQALREQGVDVAAALTVKPESSNQARLERSLKLPIYKHMGSDNTLEERISTEAFKLLSHNQVLIRRKLEDKQRKAA